MSERRAQLYHWRVTINCVHCNVGDGWQTDFPLGAMSTQTDPPLCSLPPIAGELKPLVHVAHVRAVWRQLLKGPTSTSTVQRTWRLCGRLNDSESLRHRKPRREYSRPDVGQVSSCLSHRSCYTPSTLLRGGQLTVYITSGLRTLDVLRTSRRVHAHLSARRRSFMRRRWSQKAIVSHHLFTFICIIKL